MKRIFKSGISIFLAITIIFSSAYVGLGEVDFSKIKFNGINFDGVGEFIKALTPDFSVKSLATNESGLTFGLNNDCESYYVDDCDVSVDGELVIPDTYNNLPVTRIGASAFSSCNSLSSVIIPNSVTSIGSSAFYNCTSLTSITIPESVTSIDNSTFYSCTSLTSIIIPDSVTSIGDSAFSGCTNLTSITISDSVTKIGSWAFSKTGFYKDINNWENGVLYIGNYLIEADSDIINGSYAVKNGTKCVSDYAFRKCTNLISITIPDSVTSIGYQTFADCTNLNTVIIGDGITSIGNSAFDGCTSLISVIIPDNTKNIGSYAFYNCKKLTSIDIPDTVTSIGDSAFGNCTRLITVTIGTGVTSIGDDVFKDCKYLEKVYWNAKAVSDFEYDSNVFYNAGKSGSGIEIVFGDNVEKIPEELCGVSDSLYSPKVTSITIGDRVKNIGEHAFSSCLNLEKVYWNAQCITDFYYWSEIFSNTGTAGSGISFVFGDNVEKIPAYLFYEHNSSYSPNLTSVTIGPNVKSVGSYAFYGCTNLKSVAIPSRVTNIEDYTFSNCTSLTSITIPDSVTSIGESAFSNCTSLTSITIPDSVTSIGVGVFSTCSSLISVVIGNGVANIGKETFKDCINLNKLYWNAKAVEGLAYNSNIFYNAGTAGSGIELIFGDTVEKIPAYLCCSQKTSYSPRVISITIPENINYIGSNAFYNCVSLEKIYWKAKYVADFDSYSEIFYNAGIAGPGIELVFGNAVERIPDYLCYVGDSSYGPKVISITIPDSVKSIGYYAFYNTSFYNNADNWETDVLYIGNHFIRAKNTITNSDCIKAGTKTIASGAFEYCDYLEFITIPNSVVSIGDKAFACCPKLSSITIPDSVTSIGYWAFMDCYSLVCIFYKGTKEDWSVINVYPDDGNLSNTKIHYEAIDHTPSSWITDKKATVYKAGSKHKECTVCGEVLETAEIPQLKCSKPKLKSIETTEYGVLTKWSKVTGADSYRVYRKTSKSDWECIGTTSKTYYTDKTVKSGTKYYYAIKARNEAGNSSLSSSLSKYYLAYPTLKTPSSTKSGVKLTWNKIGGAEGYMVYRKTGTGSYSRIATVKGSTKVTYTDKSAKKGKTYTYKVKAYKSKTYSAYSNAKKIKDKY